MQPAHTAQSFRKKDESVLQISLAPAALALGVFNHGLRRLFVTAFEVVGKPNLPIFARHERGLDKIVAQNLATERLVSGKLRQVAELHEWFGADDGVVSPIISQIERPIIQSRDEHWR